MKRLLMVVCSVLLAVSFASAAPCGTGDVMGLGTCDFGGLTFGNWDVSQVGFDTAMVLLAGGSVVGGVVYLDFRVLTDPSPATAPSDILFRYSVTGGLYGLDLQLGANSPPVTIIENAYTDQAEQNLLATLLVYNGSGGSDLFDEAFFASTSPVWIKKDIAFNNVGAAITDFTNSHHVPEPMTYLLMGSGLLGLGLWRRRTRKKS